MSQSHSIESGDRGELDPLLAFNAEFAAAESAEKPVNPPPPAAEDPSPLRARLDQAERSLDRAKIEISSLKSDVATLVATVEDIKKRLSRRPDVIAPPPPVKVPHRHGPGRAAVMVILLLTLGVAIWGAWSIAPIVVPQPPAPDPESVAPPPASPPVAAVPDPPAIAAPAVPAIVPAPAAVRQSAARPPAPVAYVGTLSIDAAPAGDVFINRREAGRTPVRAENLRAGSHLIWIERDGYRRWTRVVSVAANRVTRVSAALDPLGR